MFLFFHLYQTFPHISISIWIYAGCYYQFSCFHEELCDDGCVYRNTGRKFQEILRQRYGMLRLHCMDRLRHRMFVATRFLHCTNSRPHQCCRIRQDGRIVRILLEILHSLCDRNHIHCMDHRQLPTLKFVANRFLLRMNNHWRRCCSVQNRYKKNIHILVSLLAITLVRLMNHNIKEGVCNLIDINMTPCE